ncbi:MAG TPA: amino acid adenylation domain-containing protein, partial [Thermoanaerobaculia bacterium]|nr:amino acid adenylation domain-containing protein [Thermoanaerobaculia bacterium]
MRWLPTGDEGDEGDEAPALEYLGRADQQVKVRGFRIELGEIEQALVRCDGVREAAVAAPVAADGGRRLVGYVAGDGLEAAALRRQLGSWLPPHMVPGTFVVLDALPRTPNGKLDRRALPAAEESARLARAPYTAPRTPAEEAIAAAFEQALELGEVGIDDDFLALGGDSIRTLRAVAVGREMGVELSVEALLSGQSVRELAQAAASAPSVSNENLRPEPFALVPPGDRLLLAELPAAERDALEDAYPLTRLQLGMFFHAEQRPGSALYHEIFDLHAAFRFDAAALARALATVVARHPVLRTAFDGARFGEPLQLVHRRAAMPLAVVDLRGLPEAEREAAVEAAKRRELAAPLDRSRAPLARLRVCRLDDREARLLFSFHHAVLDGWSAAVMVGELLRAYAGEIGEEALPLGEAPGRAFAEFVALERRALGDDAVRELWSREAAAGGAAPLPRWPRRVSEGGEPRVELTEIAFGDEISDAVKAFARRTGVPLKSALLAAHLRVLAEVGDRRVASTGLVTNGRPETADGEAALGLFLNTLPLRLDVDGSWAELARRAHRRELELLPGRRFPLAEIQRQAGGEPLFDTLFSFLHLHVHRGVAELPGIEMLGGGLTEATNFPLVATFGLDPESRRLYLELRCDAGELTAGQVEQLAGFYRAALGRIAAAPDSPVRWPLVGEAERERNAGWNETARPYDVETTLSARIEAQAAATPEAPALGFAAEGEETAWWSYRELDERTNRLARHLRGLGVGPETRVGVAVERSHELVATLVAVHKAGGAYVPLDPDYPVERLAFMAADAGLALLVTQQHLVDGLPEVDAPLFAVDAAWDEIAGESAEPVTPLAGPDSLAYAIYTSGSTGRPKGAMLAHRGVVNRLDWMQEAFAIGEGDVVLQKTPASFDVSVWELFWPLMTGAALLVAPPGAHRDGERLAGIVRDGGVTTMHFVPSMLRAFLAAPGVEGCTGLRRVVASGEALPPDLVEAFNAALPATELHNLYGPTEASVDVTWWACPRDGAVDRVPIGAPIANTAVHVLDGDKRPLPVGVGGELHLAGVQLARGYLGRPALTAERFVPDPLSGSSKGRQPGGRLYRTGDLARWLPSGNVEYLSRLDHQVKVRGVRIELGEIEAALAALPAVREAAVLARTDDGSEARLVAYLVPEDAGSPPTVEELRTALAARLPEAYLPSAWVVLDEMPLSPAGKLDRRALPAPSGDRPELGGEYVAPRNDTEEQLAAAWARGLGVDEVGIDDDFFALGGDSIRSIRVLGLVRKLGHDLELRDLLDHPTVRRLARAVAAGEAGGRGGELIGELTSEPFSLLAAADRERLPDGVEDAYPLTRLQSGMLFHSQLSPELPVYHDVFSLRLRARFDRAALAGALAAAVARHPVLRTSFALAGYSEPLQLVHREAEVPLAVDDLRERPEAGHDAAVTAWMEAEKATPFDWTAAPLLRVQVHRRDADTFQLSLAFHHAVLDGWSVATLVTGLLGDYLARLDGTDSPEADAPAVAFRDFVALERAALASDESRRFWVDGLAGRERTTLPRWPRAEHASGTRLHPVPLGSDLSAALKRLARQAGVPVKTVLLAAHLRVLAYVCGGDHGSGASVTSGLVTTGRPESEGAESLLGLFLNTLPLAVDLPAGSWLDLVAATFAAERAALPHRRFPLAEVQRLAGGDDLFEAAFLFVHFHVYDRLRGRSDLAIEGGEFFESTNIPLLANFGVELGRGDDSGGDNSGGNLHLDLVYDAAELAAPQVAALAGRYRRALAAMTAEPKAPWAAADLLGDDERRRLLAWSTDGPQAAPPRRLDERFAATAAALPEKTALVVGEERWSYRELTRRVDRLAERLHTEGVGPGTLVGVCLERDGRLPVALLAVMAAGGAYVPLDPDYPADRVAFILDDAAAPLLVASEATAAALPADTRTLLLDAAGAVAAVRGRRTAPAAAGVEPQAGDLAYVIYTSGSTGRPKGVAIEHASASAMVEWALQTYGAAELAGVLASTSV